MEYRDFSHFHQQHLLYVYIRIIFFFFLMHPPPPEIYPLPLHAALPSPPRGRSGSRPRERLAVRATRVTRWVQWTDMPEFLPFVRQWFETTFSEATPPQRDGWDAIAS